LNRPVGLECGAEGLVGRSPAQPAHEKPGAHVSDLVRQACRHLLQCVAR
jgi:hypothetical protein